MKHKLTFSALSDIPLGEGSMIAAGTPVAELTLLNDNVDANKFRELLQRGDRLQVTSPPTAKPKAKGSGDPPPPG